MEVCNGREKIESQSKSLSAIAVGVLEDAKALESAHGVFDYDAARRQAFVVLFLFGRGSTRCV